MSIWMLLIFALCMLSGVASSTGQPAWTPVTLPGFLLTFAIFVRGILVNGIRRPVV